MRKCQNFLKNLGNDHGIKRQVNPSFSSLLPSSQTACATKHHESVQDGRLVFNYFTKDEI